MIEDDNIKIESFLKQLKLLMLELDALGIEVFKKRINNLNHNIESFSKNIIRAGLVGITSSGKSSLLNVLMGTGKEIVKEQCKATTNMILFCSKSEEPELEICFENGKSKIIKGGNIDFKIIRKYSSEDENKHNKYNIKYIKFSLPSFILDGDIEIADTPGLDAYGLKVHEDLTFREFIPYADLIIYLTSIQSPMKEVDRKTINGIIEADQRIIFVQTCKGFVEDRNYGAGKIVTKEELLNKYKEKFKKELQIYPKLKKSPVIQIETSMAFEYFQKKKLDIWNKSGLEEFVQTISEIAKQFRREFALIKLRQVVDEASILNKLIINTKNEKNENLSNLGRILERLKEYSNKISCDKQNVVSQWEPRLNFSTVHHSFKTELSKIEDNKKFQKIVHQLSENIIKSKTDFLDTIDKKNHKYNGLFKEIGLDYRRTDLQNKTKSDLFSPNIQHKVKTKSRGSNSILLSAIKLVVQKFSTDLKSLAGESDHPDRKVDYEEIREYLQFFLEPLLKHLKWWENKVTVTFCRPIAKKILSLEDDISNIKKDTKLTENQNRCLADISTKIDELINTKLFMLKKDINQYRILPGFSREVEKNNRKFDHDNLFVTLYNQLKENMFHAFYFRCLSEITNNTEKNIILFGQDFEEQLNFLKRLLRLDETIIRRLKNTRLPFYLNNTLENSNIRGFKIKNKLLNNIGFFIIDNDPESFKVAEENHLFDKADVIQVIIEDLHRVGSAITDIIERNLFYEHMLLHKEKLLLTYSKAAHFKKDRLNMMVNEAIGEVNRLFAPHRVKWFIHENFEIRYNHFYKIGLKMMDGQFSARSCMKEWKVSGIPIDTLFNDKLLIKQWEEVNYGR